MPGWRETATSFAAAILCVSLFAAPAHAADIRLFAGGATYSDTEAGITRRVDSAFLGASFPLSRRLGAQLVADHEVRHASYRRDGITLGLHWRFGR